MARRIITGIVLTIVLLGGARRLSTRNPVDIVVDVGGVRIRHRTVTEQVGPGRPVVSVQLEPAQRHAPVVRWVSPPSEMVEERTMVLEGAPGYGAYLPDLGKGKRIRYWITVERNDGGKMRLPEDPDSSLLLKFKGKASRPVVIAHVAFMFGAFFFMVMSLFGAVRILRGLEGKGSAVRAGRWVLLLSFIGGWPLGFVLNHETFGVLWEGYPFGLDVTDNKTQLILIFWLVSMLLVRGSFFGQGEGKDLVGARGLAWAIIASFSVSLALFILPHGIG